MKVFIICSIVIAWLSIGRACYEINAQKYSFRHNCGLELVTHTVFGLISVMFMLFCYFIDAVVYDIKWWKKFIEAGFEETKHFGDKP